MSIETVKADITADTTASLTWLQKHERLLIVSLVLGAVLWLGNHWLNIKAAADKQTSIVATQQLNDQKAKDIALAAQVTQLNSEYQSLVVQLSAENAQLASAISNRTVVLQQQQTTDKTLPLPDLGNRWASLAGIAPADITASQSGIAVTDTGARETVSQLEQVPVLTADLKDAQTEVTNDHQELDKANDLINGLGQQVSGLNVTIADQDKACKAEVATVKSAANKSKRNWFVRGLLIGAGAIGAIVLHF